VVVFVYSDEYEMDFEGHVFPVRKYKALKDTLVEKKLVNPEDFLTPQIPPKENLLLVHEEAYIEDFLNLRWTHRTFSSELALNESIVKGFLLMAHGTYLASRKAVELKGVGFHIGGGFHHAYPDHAEGFCYLNDIAFAIKKLQQEGLIKRAAVIDCDLHQGNGTAKIFRDDPSVFTFSIHQENLYPYPKEKSDWDIGLPNGTGDKEYLTLLDDAVKKILDSHKPELVIYQAGADPYEKDQLGDLALSLDGLKKRDEIVIGGSRKRGIPLAVTLGGGYPFDFEDVVKIHLGTALVAIKYSREAQ